MVVASDDGDLQPERHGAGLGDLDGFEEPHRYEVSEDRDRYRRDERAALKEVGII